MILDGAGLACERAVKNAIPLARKVGDCDSVDFGGMAVVVLLVLLVVGGAVEVIFYDKDMLASIKCKVQSDARWVLVEQG